MPQILQYKKLIDMSSEIAKSWRRGSFHGNFFSHPYFFILEESSLLSYEYSIKDSIKSLPFEEQLLERFICLKHHQNKQTKNPKPNSTSSYTPNCWLSPWLLVWLCRARVLAKTFSVNSDLKGDNGESYGR